MKFGACVLVIAAAGCASSAPSPTVVETPPESGAGDTGTGHAPETPRKASPISASFHLATTDTPKIGAACDAPESNTCGTAQRVAIERHGSSGLVPQSGAPTPCEPKQLGKTVETHGRSYCMDGDYLYARSICVMCRLPSYSEVVAKLDELTPAQRDELARLLGITDRAPTTTAEWSAALERRVEQ